MAKQMVSDKPMASTLQDRMKKATAPKKGSVLPQPPPPPEKEDIPTLEEKITHKNTQKELIQLTSDYVAWSAQESEAKKNKELLSERIKLIAGTFQVDRLLMPSGIQVAYYKTMRESIQKDLLLNLGVAPGVIQKATKTTESFNLRVSPPKEE